MEEKLEDVPLRSSLFNSVLETGIRSLVILEAFFPRPLDLLRITWLDHLVVHTADINGPLSLHPDTPERAGELLVRRRIVEEGLGLMRSLHLVEFQAVPEGVQYRTCEAAIALIDSMHTDYAKQLKERASWLANHLDGQTNDRIAELISKQLGSLVTERSDVEYSV